MRVSAFPAWTFYTTEERFIFILILPHIFKRPRPSILTRTIHNVSKIGVKFGGVTASRSTIIVIIVIVTRIITPAERVRESRGVTGRSTSSAVHR